MGASEVRNKKFFNLIRLHYPITQDKSSKKPSSSSRLTRLTTYYYFSANDILHPLFKSKMSKQQGANTTSKLIPFIHTWARTHTHLKYLRRKNNFISKVNAFIYFLNFFLNLDTLPKLSYLFPWIKTTKYSGVTCSRFMMSTAKLPTPMENIVNIYTWNQKLSSMMFLPTMQKRVTMESLKLPSWEKPALQGLAFGWYI